MKVTYLLGAGASSGSLPLASRLSEDIPHAVADIKKDIEAFNSSRGIANIGENKIWPNGEYGRPLLESLNWLSTRASQHNTIDTVARKYWMRGDSQAKQDTRRLKAALSCYLYYRQICSPSDKRYDSFLATILKKGKDGLPRLPDQMSILTWNYDLLLEKAFYEYCPDYRLFRAFAADASHIVHLNGTAITLAPSIIPGVPNDSEKFMAAILETAQTPFTLVMELWERYNIRNPMKQLDPGISFAWEETNSVQKAIDASTGSNVLAIVGYSFPYFNRDYDRKILSTMSSTLQVVYLQTNKDIGAKERFLTLMNESAPGRDWGKMIREVEDLIYFVIPNELLS